MGSKIHIILEKFWLFVAAVATLGTLYYFIQDGSEGIIYYVLITGMAWAMFFMRRGVRKRFDKLAAEQEELKNPKKK